MYSKQQTISQSDVNHKSVTYQSVNKLVSHCHSSAIELVNRPDSLKSSSHQSVTYQSSSQPVSKDVYGLRFQMRYTVLISARLATVIIEIHILMGASSGYEFRVVAKY
jgi:hypothetical protein